MTLTTTRAEAAPFRGRTEEELPDVARAERKRADEHAEHELGDLFREIQSKIGDARRRREAALRRGQEVDRELRTHPARALARLDEALERAAASSGEAHDRFVNAFAFSPVAGKLVGEEQIDIRVLGAELLTLHIVAAEVDGRSLRERVSTAIDFTARSPRHSALTDRSEDELKTEADELHTIAAAEAETIERARPAEELLAQLNRAIVAGAGRPTDLRARWKEAGLDAV